MEPTIYEMKLVTGEKIVYATVDTEVPPIPGFIPLAATVLTPKDEYNGDRLSPATRYISLANVAEITLTHAQLKEFGTYHIDPDRPIKVRLDNSI